ncbi:MAG: SDR family NAD(P)-dependent oxidoreductase [Cryobacterium sp.]
MSRTVSGARVLITAAATGLGRLYAERAVAEGARAVILWDGDAAALTETTAVLGRQATAATTLSPYVVDVSDLGAIAQTAQRVRIEVGNPDVIINNAGIVRSKFFWEHSNGDDTRNTMQVNALAPMYITREFLPTMLRGSGREARIVNFASTLGAVSPLRRSVEAASRAAVLVWSDTLRRELVQQGYAHVKVTTVGPNLVDESRLKGFAGALSPSAVVDRVWAAMLTGKSHLLPAFPAFSLRL